MPHGTYWPSFPMAPAPSLKQALRTSKKLEGIKVTFQVIFDSKSSLFVPTGNNMLRGNEYSPI